MQVLHTLSPLALSQQASSRLSRARSARPPVLRAAASGGQQNGNSNERNNYNVRKGKQFENSRRRRGRPAHLRSPYDSPLRDGNRDRLIGLLTERAAKTLMVYLMETNANVYSWLVEFYKKNPIPKNGSWDEVSGESFLRKLLSMPIEEAKFNTGRDSLFDNVSSCGVDPRSIAQRIMDIRTQLSEEFIQELQAIAEENSLLLRETLTTSLSSSLDAPPAAGSSKDGAPVHPELADTPPPTTASSSSKDDSSSSNGAIKGSSSSSGAVSTPPPSPTSAAPKRTPEPIKGSASSSSSSAASSKKDAADAAGKAAAVAALNAALSKPPVAGAGSTSSSSSDEKVDMENVLAQLRRAMEADVARDVMKMKEAATTSSSSASAGSNTEYSSAAAPAGTPTPLAADAAAAAPEQAAGTDSLSPTESPAPAPAAAEEPDTPVSVAAEAAAAAADGSNTPGAAAAVQASLDEDSGSSSSSVVGNTQLSSSAVGEAGTYSRMLPKGWGPRLGVGFSRYPRSRNNIVSSANLGALKPPGAAGDALSGSTAASEAV